MSYLITNRESTDDLVIGPSGPILMPFTDTPLTYVSLLIIHVHTVL